MSRPPTTLAYALLGLVDQQPRSGYDLCQVFETTPMGHYSSSPGAIYPALKRLETEELIAGETERAGSLKPRRVYRPTPDGHAALVDWVSQPPTADDLVWRIDELMLRFAFMGGLVDDAVTHRFLADFAALLDARITTLEQHLATLPGEPPHGRLALASGIAQCRGLADWAHASLATFADRLEKP